MPVAGSGSEGVTPGAAACSCGAVNRVGALFCRTCGAGLARLEPARGSTSSTVASQSEATGARDADSDQSKTSSVAGPQEPFPVHRAIECSSYIFVTFAVICALLGLIWLAPAATATTIWSFSIRLVNFARTLSKPLGISGVLTVYAVASEPLVGFTVMFIVLMRRERAAAKRSRYLVLYLIAVSLMGGMVDSIFQVSRFVRFGPRCVSSVVLTALILTCAALLYVLYALYRRIVWTPEVQQFEARRQLR